MQNKDIEKALETLRRGGIILYPTDTIWGIGCDATNSDAVKRIYRLKQRADGKAMISLVDSIDMLGKWVENVPLAARDAIACSPEPVSVIFDRPRGIARELRAEDGSAAFRVVALPFIAELIHQLDRPLVSTSANVSGQPSAPTFPDISREILDGVDYVMEYGRLRSDGASSRILKISDNGDIITIR